ncbi:FISUMP domain-containing protein [Polaribacter cellanae]|uniref:Fibrobacter succinogenes major paralogous domain-containing protein n=1 Tax=Polaribacter cellanae TaxID=2818493 RepID=A0A975CUK2_9FLAO|nr:FISUMP domain-containing protein [Polaribacter cellanae]QTE23771.1 hypothetical protein J3359_05755 [Polaribacter cellanae]
MKKILFSVAFIAASFTSMAQVGVGTTTPHSSAALEIQSTTKGFLPPRVTLAQLNAIASPAEGLIVYCLDCTTKGLYAYNGLEFIDFINGQSTFKASVDAFVAASTNPAAGGTPTLAELAAIGITGLTGRQTSYEVAIADAAPAPTTFAELQTIVNDVNTAELNAILTASTTPASGGTPSLADLTAVGLTGITAASQAIYEEAIAEASPTPTTLAELQTVINRANTAAINNIVTASTNPAAGGTPSLASLTAVGVTGLTADQTIYEEAIADASPAPTTLAELQVIIDRAIPDAINNIVAASTNPAAGGTPSLADLTAVGVTEANLTQTAYEEAIADAAPAPTTLTELQAIIDAANVASGKDVSTAVVEFTGPNGRVWMDRNLGATQAATSMRDAAALGDLYQWGRRKDGHEKRTSTVTSTQATTANPGHGNFITNAGNWTTFANSDTFWQAGLNDPCPLGYRVPTEAEFTALGATNANDAFTILKLTVSDFRVNTTGALKATTNADGRGASGAYWSSTVTGTSSRSYEFSPGATPGSPDAAKMYNSARAYGLAIRCIKN